MGLKGVRLPVAPSKAALNATARRRFAAKVLARLTMYRRAMSIQGRRSTRTRAAGRVGATGSLTPLSPTRLQPHPTTHTNRVHGH